MEIRRSGNFGIIDTGSDKGLISFSIGGRGKGWEPSGILLNRRGAFFSRKISVNGTFIVPMGDNNDMPGEVMDKEIIEYHGRPDGRPILKIRILPDEEEFHEEEMNMVYKGIYVRQKLLFDGEIMEYEIWENEDGRLVKKAEGEVTCSEPATGDKGNRFTALYAMNLYLGMKDDRKLKESMTEYVTDSQIAKKLFRLA